MSLYVAAVLGVVQALTEFLPVSSTAHLLVFGELFGQSLSDDRFRAFVAIIQTGTTLAVIIYFRAELWRLASAAVRGLARGKPTETAEARLAWLIVLGTIPAALLGKLLERRIEELGNMTMAFALVAGFFVIGWLLRYLRTRTTYVFVAWRVAAGLLIAVLLWRGVLPTSDEEAPPPTPPHAP